VKRIRFGSERRRRLILASTLRMDTRRNTERFLVACAISIAIWPLGNTARAQDVSAARPLEFGLMAGGVGVTGQFRGKMSSGIVGGAVLQIPLSPRWLALRADLMYMAIVDPNEPCPDFRGNCSSASEIASGGLGVVARLSATERHWSPYVVAGVATYHIGHFISPAVATIHTNPFGWQGGLGVEVRSSRHVFSAEMRYMAMAPGGVAPIVIGMRF
jgi:opacity protein-like surface antigen